MRRVLTNQPDVHGAGLDLQAGPHQPLTAGQPGGHGGLAQTLIGDVEINQ